MDKLIRTLALFGRPFPPELRELYFQMERNYAKRARGPDRLSRAARTPPKANPFERDSRAPRAAE